MARFSISSPSASSDHEYEKFSSGDLTGLWRRQRRTHVLLSRIIVAAWLLGLWATGLLSIFLLWLMGAGYDPLVILASAPF